MRRQLMFTIVGIALLVLLAVLVSGSAMPLAPQAPPPPAGDTIPSVTLPSSDIGKFVLALRRGDDGRWLIAADIDNGNSRR